MVTGIYPFIIFFRPDLMVKKLRYYARFIVVCLLLKKMKLVRDLVRELSKHIDEYTATYEPEDQLEWSLVLGEIKAFIEADTIVNVLDSDSNSIVLSHRYRIIMKYEISIILFCLKLLRNFGRIL